jgi:hypothetical protein
MVRMTGIQITNVTGATVEGGARLAGDVMHRLILALLVLALSPTNTRAQQARAADAFRVSGEYQRMLARFSETPLDPPERVSRELYRAIVWPTFETPMLVRVEDQNGKYLLTAKRLRGDGGYNPQGVSQSTRRWLKRSEWRRLLALLDAADFRRLSTDQPEPAPNADGSITVCLDSTTWIIEGIRDGEYHVAARYCPDEAAFKAAGLYLVRLTRFRVQARDL